MKRLLIPTFTFLLVLYLILLGGPPIVSRISAQMPELVIHKLSPEASKRWAAINAEEQDYIRRAQAVIDQYEERKKDIVIGATIPEDSRVCSVGADGIVVCAKPAKQEAAKTAPK